MIKKRLLLLRSVHDEMSCSIYERLCICIYLSDCAVCEMLMPWLFVLFIGLLLKAVCKMRKSARYVQTMISVDDVKLY